MAGLDTEISNLQRAGFSASEISEWQAETRGQLQQAGYSENEINKYFGVKDPDMSGVKNLIKTNTENRKAAASPQAQTEAAPKETSEASQAPQIKEAETFLEALESGFDISVTGLMRDRPDMALKPDAGMWMRIASQVGTLAGDAPAMIAGAVAGGAVGGVAGGAAGSYIPGVGSAAGAAVGAKLGQGAGAFALPEAMRQVMMQHYEKGDVKSFEDFWERTSVVFIESLKAGATGAATVGVGGLVTKGVAKTALPAAAKTSTVLASEVSTMTLVGGALHGHVPEPEHFVEAAIVVGALKGTGLVAGRVPKTTQKVAGKLRQIYAKTGKQPAEVAAEAQTNPALKQKLLSESVSPEQIAQSYAGGSVTNPKPPAEFKVTKPLAKEFVPEKTLAPEIQAITSKISEKQTASKPGGPETIEGYTHTRLNEYYTNVVDKLDPINRATQALQKNVENLPADKNPYILSRMTVDAKAKAKHVFEKGTLDFNTRATNGKGLRQILEKVENLQEFEAFLVAKRAIEVESRGKKSGFDMNAARAVSRNYGKKYEALAAEFTAFNNRVLQYVSDAGVLSKQSYKNMVELNKNYVSFKRITELQDGAKVTKGGKAGSLKEFKGSDKDIQSPITSTVENTIQLLEMAERNRAPRALVELAKESGSLELLKPVKQKAEAVQIPEQQVAKFLEDKGVDPKLAEPLTAYRRKTKDLTPNQFEVYIDGKRKVFETRPEIAEAIKTLGGDGPATNMFFRLARGVTTVKKFGITFTPDFIVRNFFRDALTSSVFTKGGKLNPMDIFGAVGDLIKRNDTYYNWLKSGGANGAFLELNNRYVKNNITKLQKETNFLSAAQNVVRKPVDAMRVAAELSEQAIRLAEFKKVSGNATKGTKLVEGGFASREVTLDFQRVGLKLSALNSITAFLNVSIQGLDKTGRAIKGDPVGVTTKSLAYITTPSVLLWLANKDDPRYAEIPRWQKDHFWIVMTDDTIYRIPKPMELGVVFGSLPERLLEGYFNDNPKAFKEFNDTVLKSVTPSMVPDAVAPAIEQYFNKSFFTGNDIVPYHLKDLFPEYQFVEYTSETAKTLGSLVATIDKQSPFASPVTIDNYLRSWGGSLGQYALQLADQGLKKAGIAEDIPAPSLTLADIPFVKSFAVRYPSAGAASIQDFYDNYDKTNSTIKTIKHLAKQGDFENLEKELSLEENRHNMQRLDGIKRGISTQRQFISQINRDPGMSPDEKRQMIDGIYLMMIEISKQGNTLMEDIRKELGE